MSPFYLKLSMALSTVFSNMIPRASIISVLWSLSLTLHHISPCSPCSSHACHSSVPSTFVTGHVALFLSPLPEMFCFFCPISVLPSFPLEFVSSITFSWDCSCEFADFHDKENSLNNSVYPSYIATAINFLKFLSFFLDFKLSYRHYCPYCYLTKLQCKLM